MPAAGPDPDHAADAPVEGRGIRGARHLAASMMGWLRLLRGCRLCAKVGATVLVGIVVVEAIILIPSVDNYKRDLIGSLSDESRATARALAWIAGPDDGALASQVIQGTHIRGIRIYDLSGRTIMSAGEEPMLDFDDARREVVMQTDDGSRMGVGWAPDALGAPLVASAQIDRSWVSGELWSFAARIFGLVVLISTVVTAATMAILARSILLPIVGLRDKLNAAAHDPDRPDRYIEPSHRHDEVGDLIEAFNHMLRDVGRSHREQVRRLAAMTENSLAATFAYDLDGRLVYCNNAAARMCGVETQDDLISSGYPEVMVGDAHIPLSRFLERRPATGEQLVRAGPAGIIPCLLSASTLTDEDGATLLHCVSLFDVTEMHRYRAKLEAQNMDLESANRAKSEFLAHMSHELRTPLNAIIGFSQMIEGEHLGPLGNETYREYAADIHHSGAHLLAIISDILDISKIESGNAELSEHLLDLDQVVADCLRLVNERARQANVALHAETAPDLPRLYADERMVKQILLNLLANAIKFTSAGGSIVVRAAAEGEGLSLSVCDTGVGMSPADLSRALAPFGQVDNALTREHEGTGLGLPLVQKLAQLHDARLDIDSTPGEGTTVTIQFPCVRTREGRPRAAVA